MRTLDYSGVKLEPCERKQSSTDKHVYIIRLPSKEEYETTFHFHSKKVCKRRKTGTRTTRGVAREPPPEERQLRGHFKSPCTLTIDTNEPDTRIATYCMHKYGKDPKSSQIVSSVPFYVNEDTSQVAAHTISPNNIEFYTKSRRQYFDFEFGDSITISSNFTLRVDTAALHHRVASKLCSIPLECKEMDSVKKEMPKLSALVVPMDKPLTVKRERLFEDNFSDDEVEITLSPISSPCLSSKKRKPELQLSSVDNPPPLELDGLNEMLPSLSRDSSSESEDVTASSLSPIDDESLPVEKDTCYAIKQERDSLQCTPPFPPGLFPQLSPSHTPFVFKSSSPFTSSYRHTPFPDLGEGVNLDSGAGPMMF